MSSTRNRFLTVILIVFALTAAACGGDSNDAATGEDASTESDVTAASGEKADASDASSEADEDAAADTGEGDGESDATTTPDADEGSGDPTQDAIDEILSQFSGDAADFADEESRWEEQTRAVEQSIQECMRAEGFEYSPQDYSQFTSFELDEYNPDSREWRETNGFGVTMGFEDFSDISEGGPEDFADPNRDYYDTLSEGEQRAYDQALYGDQVESELEGEGIGFATEPTDEEMDAYQEAYENRENKGCMDEAWSQVDQGNEAVYSVLEDAWEDIEARVITDPRIAGQIDEWSVCLSEAGYTYTDPQEMYDDAYSKTDELYSDQAFVDPFEGLTEDEVSNMTDEQLEALAPSFDIDEELLAEIREWEIKLALASFDCGEVEMNKIGEEIYQEALETFLDENRDKIGEALAAGN